MSLAQLGRLDEARTVLLRGQQLQPEDARFPIELSGIAFKQKQYGEATKWLQRGLRLNANDEYATDFLATVYFLQGNLEAALKYWNKLGKPQIENVKLESGLRIDPVLLDRAFAFAPASTLSLSDLLTTRARVLGLGVFPVSTIRLEARDDGRFDVSFAAQERNGFGSSKIGALLSTFRGVGFQTVTPEYFNLRRSAINITSLMRWDAQKRRLLTSISAPLGRDARRRYFVGLDLRDEKWEVSQLGQFALRRNAIAGGVTSFRSGGWSWSAGGEFSHRDYAGVGAYQLKQTAQLNRELWHVPERRFESSVSISSELGTVWAGPTRTFEKLQGSLTTRWLPKMTGDDYATQLKIGLGKTFGSTPFDEFYILGLERDNDLWMRAHIGTADGRKGSAPLGRQYFLSNWEIDKSLYGNGLVSVKLSPFLDIGRTDANFGIGSKQWLWDTGVQAKVQVLGVGFVFVYGKDLRTGKNSFYAHSAR